MAFAPMTVVIPSYQRRELLTRLLRTLDEQLVANVELAVDLDVVVVLDGSTDGSKEAVERHSWSVPVRVQWQPNRGRAAARNAGLERAAGRLVWFLDDDLVPAPGLVERHRRAHCEHPSAVVVGPCRMPADVHAPESVTRWWASFNDTLERRRVIDRFDLFTSANFSAPADVLIDADGFDASFVEYGMEDHEFAVRLLERGVPFHFDARAIAWHPDIPPMKVLVARQYEIGRNTVRLLRLHPGTAEALFPPDPASRVRRLLRWSRLRDPKSLMAVSSVAFVMYRATRRIGGRPHLLCESLALNAAYAAGIAAGEPTGTLLGRMLGYTGDVRSE